MTAPATASRPGSIRAGLVAGVGAFALAAAAFAQTVTPPASPPASPPAPTVIDPATGLPTGTLTDTGAGPGSGTETDTGAGPAIPETPAAPPIETPTETPAETPAAPPAETPPAAVPPPPETAPTESIPLAPAPAGADAALVDPFRSQTEVEAQTRSFGPPGRRARARARALRGVGAAQGERGLGGVTLSFGVAERLEASDNQALRVDSDGGTGTATTDLSFGIRSETPTDFIALDGGFKVRAIGGAGSSGRGTSGFDTSVDEPRLAFRFAREGARSAASLTARYLSADIAYLDLTDEIGTDPIDPGFDPGGPIVVPGDADLIRGTGTRASYGFDGTLDLFEDAPVGLALAAGINVLDYSDVTANDLVNTRRSRAAATVVLRFSPVTEGRVGVRTTVYDADNAIETHRETNTLDVGVTRTISDAATLDATLGYSTVDTFTNTDPRGRTEGVTGRVGLALDRPNGTATAEITADTTQSGTRTGFRLGRSFELPAGSIGATLGATKAEGGDPKLAGSLTYRRDLPSGGLTARLSRDVRTGNDDTDRLATAATLGLTQRINDVSALGFTLAYLHSDPGGGDTTDRTSFNATWSRDITADWSLAAGYRYRSRDEDPGGKATSNTVFLTLSRDFTGVR